MTDTEIQRLTGLDGLWLLGDRRFASLCQPVFVKDRTAHRMLVGARLSDDPADWPETTFIASGPHTLQSDQELSAKAEAVADEVTVLDWDLDFWRNMALQMKPYVQATQDDQIETIWNMKARDILDQCNAAQAAELATQQRMEAKA